MLVNLSNHPIGKWDVNQLEAAKVYGDMMDLPFPQIPPENTEEDICQLCKQYLKLIQEKAPIGSAVMVQGEFTFTYQIVNLLKAEGYVPLAACSKRMVEERYRGGAYEKIVGYEFVKFRKY